MKAYILSIAGVILLSAVVTVIAPSGKMGKFVKGTMKLFILVVMLAPLIGWVQGKGVPLGSPAEVETDAGYLDSCADYLESQDEKEIESYIQETYKLNASVESERARSDLFPLRKIRVILQKDGITAEDERIYIVSSLMETLNARYGAETEVMWLSPTS